MKKRIFGMLLMGAMVVASVSMFTSCKDYDDDINKLQKEIDAITAQNLQTQLTTLQSALATAQSTADAAKSAAAEAEAAAKKAQETGDAAAKDAADAATVAVATAAAASQDVEDLQKAIADVQALLDGKVSKDDLSAAITEVEKKIVAINENLLTLDDVKKLLEDEGFASAAVVRDIESQIEALKTFQQQVEALKLDASWKKKVDDAVASLTQIKKDIAAKADKTTVDQLKKSVDAAVDAMGKVDSFAGSINSLNVFAKRNLRSINLSPAKFYGGIEAIDIFAFTPKEEKMNDKWHFFKRGSNVTLSEIGYADYHISPKSVDLTNFQVGFFTRSSDIIEPATTEKTRAHQQVTNTNRLKPVYTNTDDLIKNKNWNAGTGILTVPYKVDNAVSIANELKAGKGTIAALQLSKDTTVTSDYALVVPTISELLLITDKSFASQNTGTTWNDVPGLNNTAVNNYHLHRNFSYLAISKTTATHEIVFNKSFNISEVLGVHAIDPAIVTTTAAKAEKNIKDTAEIALPERATAIRYNYDPTKDSDASLLKKYCTDLDAAKLKELGLYFDVHRVGYSLGTTKTEESNHIEILEENGQFIAYPRNINADNGETVTGKTANASAVGRMPIVCIELKYQKGDKPAATDPTVTFAYMKFLIVKDKEETPEAKTAEFKVSDVWADCGDASGQVAWYQIEGKVYDELLHIDKKTFDNRYVFDFYKEETVANEDDKTQSKDKRYGYRFKKSGKGYAHDKDSIGQVVEEWNISAQGKEDATTHIIKWYFTTADYIKVYKDLKARGKLKYDWEKGQMTNTEEIVTYVRYAYKSSYHKGNMNVTDGDPAVYIQLTIPVGAFHWALGSLGGTKTLTYWYELNSSTNAPDKSTAREVRVNVPVPVPDAKTTITTLSALNCPWGEALQIKNDNLLERTEFLKDLHDYFRNGKLEAAVTDKSHFKKLAQANITPEFSFTLPSKSLGNATFDAKNGQWTVKGISGKSYTLKLNAAKNQILIVGSPDEILCSLTDDDNAIQSVIKYHEGVKQDDILNYKTHNELGELETFTAYIMIDTPDACAPIEFDDMWFNVRFLRPLDLIAPKGDVLPDAPNDWQYIDLAEYARIRDWRDYYADPQNRIGGDDKTVAGYKVDFKYYQVGLNTDENLFLTDAGLGTNERDPYITKADIDKMKDINTDAAYKAKLWKTAEVNGLLVQKTDKKGGDQVPNSTKSTWIRYKNNSGVTGGFHIYLPIQMTYVFGNYPQTTQTTFVTLAISKSVNQDQE